MLSSQIFILQKHPILFKPCRFNHGSILGRKKVDSHMISIAMYFQPAILKKYGIRHRTILGKKQITGRLPASGSSSSSFSSSSTAQTWTYDVFLSFRGTDTRNNFLGHLYGNLVRKEIKTFLDEDTLERGEELSPAINKAIENSRISIVVFSENYASSKWCLEELVKILHCKESNQQLVYPVFYKVDPSDVRHQRGTYGQAFDMHENRFRDNMEQVMRWREALTKAANLSGMHFVDGGCEFEFIEKVVEEISRELLDRMHLSVAEYPVGIESRTEEMLKLLRIGENDVHMVGIWGVGGIGKSTIAKAVYNSVVSKFEGSCYLENIRERSITYVGQVELQKTLLSKTLHKKELEVTSVTEGITVINQMLRHKRVLIILDDVDHLSQLSNIVGKSPRFGLGSRIIITTRDKHCLVAYDVNDIYEVKELSHHEALELFKFHAFREIIQDDGYAKLVDSIIHYAQGLPLALKVLGSYLRGRSVHQWKSALDGYRRESKYQIQKILESSYDSLEDLTKETFLHIACFFKGQNKEYVMSVLRGCDLNPEYGIEVLVEKALITISEENKIWMHDLLEELGKDIVWQESPTEPGKRSRLWRYEDVYHVFSENTGTDKVRGIVVDHMHDMEEKICLNNESFLKLKSLQVFRSSSAIFTGDYVNYLPNELRLLHWHGCPLLSFPYNFNPKSLVALSMSDSEITSPLGETPEMMQNLKYIILSNCHGVTKLKLSGIPNLEYLNLSGCENLTEVEVGYLNNFLVSMNFSWCGKLEKLEIKEDLKSLKILNLRKTGIRELLSSTIRCLSNLEQLRLSFCSKLEHVASNIFELQRLQLLDLSRCENLVTFPTKSEFSTESTSLQDKQYAPLFVDLRSCYNLVEIGEIPREIYGLNASDCYSLERISKFSNILEAKESQMIPSTNLSRCGKLYLNSTALFSLFFWCRESEYRVFLPRTNIPEWFTCRKDFGMDDQVCNFIIEFPGNFNWKDKGLAFFCALSADLDAYMGELNIYINGVSIVQTSTEQDVDWWGCLGFVWLYYLPFYAIIKRLSKSGLPPPSICHVQFVFDLETIRTMSIGVKQFTCAGDSLGSLGVHVVLPEDKEPFVHQLDNED